MTFTERNELARSIKQVLDEPEFEYKELFNGAPPVRVRVSQAPEWRLALLFEQLLADEAKKNAPSVQKGR